MKKLILEHEQIRKKLRRIAYQIYENHLEASSLVIAGIADNGFVLASLLQRDLEEISGISVKLVEIKVNKQHPSEKTTGTIPALETLEKEAVIIVDDVLNTGKTMAYALYPFFKAKFRTIRTAVLADRNHKRFPFSADYVGISLATTLQEHIAFEQDAQGVMSVHLS